MSAMGLVEYLGVDVNALLRMQPFAGWEVRRSIEEDLPERRLYFEFEGHGVELICDDAERVRTIFLHRGAGEELSEIPFSLSRREVVQRLGAPSKSGQACQIPVLGNQGAWDRFTLATAVIHVQYRPERDEIEMITLMRPDAVP